MNRTYVNVDDELLLQISPTIILKSFCCLLSLAAVSKNAILKTIKFSSISYCLISKIFVLLLALKPRLKPILRASLDCVCVCTEFKKRQRKPYPLCVTEIRPKTL